MRRLPRDRRLLASPLSLSPWRTAARLRAVGAIATATGLTVMSLPLAAAANETGAHSVSIAASITEDGTDAAALAGVQISVRSPYGDDTVLASGVTGADGTLSLRVEGEPTSYVADAVWPGTGNDLQSAEVRTEFLLGSEAPVNVTFWGAYGAISGSIAATAGGTTVTDLSGAMIEIANGGTTVQRVALGADGSFSSGALPTSELSDYSLSFAPPAGFDLAGEQTHPNPTVSLRRGAASPVEVEVERTFALVSRDAPTPGETPTPTPEPTVTPEPTPAPEPTVAPEPTPTPEPTQAPAPAPSPVSPESTGAAVSFGAAPTFGAALNGSSEPQLTALLAAVVRAGGQTVLVTNSLNQVLGMAFQPTASQSSQAMQALAPVTANMPGVSMNAMNVQSMDLETALMMVQSQRTQLLDTQLASQIQDVQSRNNRIGVLNGAMTAVQAYLASPTQSTFATATAATTAAGIIHPFLSATATTGSAAAETLVTVLKGSIDSVSNTQQMDMLRLQSMSNKRNEAFDVMTNFVRKMQESRSSIIGNMRSTPVAIGTTQWNSGRATGSFDLSRVPDGEHHLILNFAEMGTTLISSVSVQRGELAATGTDMTPVLSAGVALMVLGIATFVGAPLLRRRQVQRLT